MLTVLSCLTTEHDHRLVLAAALVCLIATWTTARLYARAQDRPAHRRLWLSLTGVAAGCGVWATHFIAMLAFQPGGLATGYEPAGTALSLLVAVVAMGAGFTAAALGPRPWGVASGGLLVGAGVGAMHFTGMTAFLTQGQVIWDQGLVAAAMIIGMALGPAALAVMGGGSSRLRSLLGAGILTLGICGLHFTAMAAATIVPDPGLAPPQMALSPGAMAALTAALAGIVVLGALGVGLVESWSHKGGLLRLREAIDAMPEGLGFFDAEDRCVVWNARYAELNAECAPLLAPGVPFTELLTAGLSAGHYPEAAGREEEWLAERLAARRQGACMLEQLTADGRWLRVEDKRTADGGTVTVVVDVTELKRDAEALAMARDEAESANRAKSEFLANMSHEIRTPLNGVIGLTDVLAASGLRPDQQEMVDLIRSSGVTLQQLLSDILDLARIESGRVTIRSEAFDLPALVRDVAGLHDAPARQKGLALAVDIGPGLPRHVSGDDGRLRQVLTNLLSNAIKFTDSGSVRLAVAVGAGDHVSFEVRDTGVGFDAEHKQRLFGRFEQADGSITRRFGGSGLGLAICSELVAMMGGELDCDSVPGQGSTFRLSLPLARTSAPRAEAPAPLAEVLAEPAAGEAAQRPLRVLLADDHPTNRKVITLILDHAGVELTTVENGAEAVQAFETSPFDAVLMDMQMPVMDGLAATRQIRLIERVSKLPPTPVIMLTANALPEHVEATRAAGADRHLSKPISAPVLLRALAEITRNRPGRQAA